MPSHPVPPATSPPGRPTAVAVIPLKAVRESKTRLAAALSPADRAVLLHRTFQRVAGAVRDARLVSGALVVAGDEQGAGWARALGLDVVAEPPGRHGLNAAIAMADGLLGTATTVVLPADLPLVGAGDLDAVVDALDGGMLDGARRPGVVVAPTSDGGTGALVRRPGGVVAPRFGPGSALAHRQAAAEAGVACTTTWLPGLALDLDSPGDLASAGGWSAVTGPRTLGP